MYESILASVAVPIYNTDAYVSQCIESILTQTHSNFELILVDDGSSDNSPAICDEYAKKDSRIRVIHQANAGLSAARNAAIDIAEGEFFLFVDSDDFIHPKALEILIADCLDNNCKMTVFKAYDTSKREIPANFTLENNVKAYTSDYLFEHPGMYNDSCCTKMFHRSIFDTLRFPVGLLYEDSAIVHQCIFNAENVAISNAVLYFYFLSPNSIMRSVFSVRNLDILKAKENQMDLFLNIKQTMSLKAVMSDYEYTISRILCEVKYSDKISSEEKKTIIYDLKKKYKDVHKKNKENAFFTRRMRIVSFLLYHFPLISKINKKIKAKG